MVNNLDDSLLVQLKELRVEHRQLDHEISTLMAEAPSINQLELQRMKKRKLWLKDAIVRLESDRIPDLDA
jgi:hypothetical protein